LTGLLEVVAPTIAFDDVRPVLADVAVHTAQEFQRTESDKKGRANVDERTTASFTWGSSSRR
jgi:hypothetical protein